MQGNNEYRTQYSKPGLAGFICFCFFFCLTGIVRSSDLMKIYPLTDKIIMIEFDDGYVDFFGYGETGNDDVTYNNPLNTASADLTATYQITSPDDPNYSAAQNPITVGRKSKPEEVSLVCLWNGSQCDNDTVLDHWIYLELPTKMQSNRTYTIDTSTLAANSNSATFVYNEFYMRSEAVHVNNIGYIPDAQKKYAYVSAWMGDMGALDLSPYSGTQFHVVRNSDKAIMFSGTLVFRKAATSPETASGAPWDEGPNNNFIQADVYECDFSAYTPADTDEEYIIVVEGIGASFPFLIKSDTYREAFYTTIRGLYHQRAGIAKELPYTDWTVPRDHHGEDINIQYTTYQAIDGINFTDRLDAMMASAVSKYTTWGWYHDAGDWDMDPTHLMVPRYLL